MLSSDDVAEGSPIDRAVFFLLIVAGTIILSKRKIDWGQFLSLNKWIALYYLYCLSSITWTDEPFILFKRWIKDLGNPIIALVILTEQRPYEAVGVVLRRLAFLLLPLSVLFIKYYPELGRAYPQGSAPMYTGVSEQKNGLGMLCLISGIYFAWKFLQNRKWDFKWVKKGNLRDYILIGMLAWLLYMSNSQTSLVCLVVATGLLFVSRNTFILQKPSRIIVVMICSILMFSILEVTLHVKDLILSLLGRDPTLTNRTEIWDVLIGLVRNPVIGTGFMSFWTGDRMELSWGLIGGSIIQAHNGYIEQYLNLGYIGVAFMGVIILSGLLKVRKHLDVDPLWAMLRLCFIVVAILYNYTEAAFFGINNMWFLLLLGTIDISNQHGIKKIEINNIKERIQKSVIVASYHYNTAQFKVNHK
jgi:exopolysaccharide production protein ExoQ